MQLHKANKFGEQKWWWRCALSAVVCLTMTPVANLLGQSTVELPRPAYYAARDLLRAGNIADATHGFRTVLENAQRTSTGGWVDSIPPLVMLGECLYLQGNLTQALRQFDLALQTTLQYPGWLERFNLGEVAQTGSLGNSSRGINWFQLSRPSVSVNIPGSVQLHIDATRALVDAQGNVIAPVLLMSRLDVGEVLRCLGHALYRRWQILGPLAAQASLTTSTVEYFSYQLRSAPPWAHTSWVMLRGLAQLSRDPAQAVRLIRQSSWIEDRFDYFFTPLGQLILGRQAAMQGQYQAALVHLQDASLFSALHEQHETLAEIMQWLGNTACANQRIDLLDALRSAGNWCSKRSVYSQAACVVSAMELSLIAGNTSLAKKLASRELLLQLREQPLPRIHSRLAYVDAIAAFADGQPAIGWNRLSQALSLMRGKAATGPIPERVFQQQQTLDLLSEGQLTQKDGDQILSELLSEPQRVLWQLQPVETLAALTTSSAPAYARWLKLADSSDAESVAVRMDHCQRRHLYEALPLAGRVLAWRQALSQPVDELPAEVRPIVQDAIGRQPVVRELFEQLSLAVQQLRQAPIPLDDSKIKPDARQTFERVANLSEQFEAQLTILAASRQPLRRFAPAEFHRGLIQQELTPGDVLTGWVVAGEQMYGLAINQQQMHVWQVTDGAAVQKRLMALYLSIGLHRKVGDKLPADAALPSAQWRTLANELFTQLFSPDSRTMIGSAQRLIVAPHGWTWYVPVELLCDAQRVPLQMQTSVCYIPTLGSVKLALGSRPQPTDSLLMAGNLFSLDKSVSEREAKILADASRGTTLIFLNQKNATVPALWQRVRFDELLLVDGVSSDSDGWQLRALPLDNRPAGQLQDWLHSSAAGNHLLWLPGNDSSVRNGQLGNGDDLFLPACAMLLSGSQGVLSRWSSGGTSGARYLQRARLELARSQPLSIALRRASLALWSEQFAMAEQPIFKPLSSDSGTLASGEHPLLWGGYMAIGDNRP
ncbi:MAG: CHAT domain-containing protein [Pirellulaceae bacterium]|nr:CHAT domain-containing protein [Pirellulaceae bacterium]